MHFYISIFNFFVANSNPQSVLGSDKTKKLLLIIKARLNEIEMNVSYFVRGIKPRRYFSAGSRYDLNQRQTDIQRSDKSALRYCLHLGTHLNIWKIRFFIAPANGTQKSLIFTKLPRARGNSVEPIK